MIKNMLLFERTRVWVLISILNASSRRSSVFIWLHQHSCGTHAYMQAKHHTCKIILQFLQLALSFPVEVGYDLAAVVQTDLSSVGDVCLRLSLHCSHGLAVRRGQQIWSPRVGAEAPGPLSTLDL